MARIINGVRFSPHGVYLAVASESAISDLARSSTARGDGDPWLERPHGLLRDRRACNRSRVPSRSSPSPVAPGWRADSRRELSAARRLLGGRTLLAVGPAAASADDTLVQIFDRVRGAEAARLSDDPQTRPPQIRRQARYVVGLTFAGPDRIAVAWDDGRLGCLSLVRRSARLEPARSGLNRQWGRDPQCVADSGPTE